MKRKLSMLLFAAMLSATAITSVKSVKAVEAVDVQLIAQSSIVQPNVIGPGDPPPM